MDRVQLKPIISENWKACINLKLHPDQEKFVPSNLYSMVEAQLYPEAHSLAIYAGENELVGYMLYGKDFATESWKIFRLMIDLNHQGKGYGEAAIQCIASRIRASANPKDILIAYQDNNCVARELYRKLGFIEQGHNDQGSMVAKLSV